MRTWSYTWACGSAPAKEPSGEATLTVASPRGNETIRLTYSTEGHLDGPSLVFRAKEAESPKRDRFVWHQKYFGAQIYGSISRDLDRPGLQRTYVPAGDAVRALVESTLRKPGKLEPQE